MRVDLPAPFSPSRAWISPGSAPKSTLDNARTPGNSLLTPVILSMRACLSVLPVGEFGRGLVLGVVLLDGDDAPLDALARLHLLDDLHQLRTEQRVALHQTIDLAG